MIGILGLILNLFSNLIPHLWAFRITLKKIGLISDTHSYMDDRILEHFKDRDQIWHAGDIGKIEVMDQLSEIAPVKGVHGNIDNAKIRSEFPLHQKFLCEGMKIWLTHIGGPVYAYDYRIREQLKANTPDIFICGHSHICKVQMDKRLKMLYMNPGAAGKHGIHKVRTILRFNIDLGKIKDLEVVELGLRAKNQL